LTAFQNVAVELTVAGAVAFGKLKLPGIVKLKGFDVLKGLRKGLDTLNGFGNPPVVLKGFEKLKGFVPFTGKEKFPKPKPKPGFPTLKARADSDT
jgi:hypothetical protein